MIDLPKGFDLEGVMPGHSTTQPLRIALRRNIPGLLKQEPSFHPRDRAQLTGFWEEAIILASAHIPEGMWESKGVPVSLHGEIK